MNYGLSKLAFEDYVEAFPRNLVGNSPVQPTQDAAPHGPICPPPGTVRPRAPDWRLKWGPVKVSILFANSFSFTSTSSVTHSYGL